MTFTRLYALCNIWSCSSSAGAGCWCCPRLSSLSWCTGPVSCYLLHADTALGGPANPLAMTGSQEAARKDEPGLWRWWGCQQ